jgi:hypothetical protein
MVLAISCNDNDPTIIIPEVLSTSTVEDAKDVGINSIIEIKFNKDMDATTINTTTFTLKEGGNEVVGTVAYLNKTATFSPINNLDPITLYTGTLSNEAKDLTGAPIAYDYSFSFTTEVLIDVILPTITLIDPVDNATNVVGNKVISITFSEDMSAASLTSTSFVVVLGANPIAGSIGSDEPGREAQYIILKKTHYYVLDTFQVNGNVSGQLICTEWSGFKFDGTFKLIFLTTFDNASQQVGKFSIVSDYFAIEQSKIKNEEWRN